MNPVKMQVLEEIIEYLTQKQGGNLKSLMDESNQPMPEEGMEGLPGQEGMIDDQALEQGSDLGGEVPEIEATPEGEVQDVAMGEMDQINPGQGDKELTDEELEALLSQMS